eukprot:1496276-Amphidinium_carterae.1
MEQRLRLDVPFHSFGLLTAMLLNKFCYTWGVMRTEGTAHRVAAERKAVTSCEPCKNELRGQPRH